MREERGETEGGRRGTEEGVGRREEGEEQIVLDYNYPRRGTCHVTAAYTSDSVTAIG